MERIKVLIADDHYLVRRGLTDLLGKAEPIEIVGDASDGAEAVSKAKSLKPDLVLMDLNMPGFSGVEATRQLKAEMPEVKVLMLTVSEREADLVDALKSGARGYMLKNEDLGLIVQAIQYVSIGGTIVSPAMANKLQSEQSAAGGTSDKYRSDGDAPTGVKVPLAQENHDAVDDSIETVSRVGKLEGSPTIAHGIGIEGDVELVVSPPFEPKAVLRLQSWLEEVASAHMTEVSPTWAGDTVIKVILSKTTPFVDLLAESPVVANVIQEHSGGDTLPNRFRLDLHRG